MSAETPPTTNDLTLSSTTSESVYFGDDCTSATLHTSIVHVGMLPLSGPLELLSSINNAASTTTCNIILNSEVSVEISTTIFTCIQTGEYSEFFRYSLNPCPPPPHNNFYRFIHEKFQLCLTLLTPFLFSHA